MAMRSRKRTILQKTSSLFQALACAILCAAPALAEERSSTASDGGVIIEEFQGGSGPVHVGGQEAQAQDCGIALNVGDGSVVNITGGCPRPAPPAGGAGSQAATEAAATPCDKLRERLRTERENQAPTAQINVIVDVMYDQGCSRNAP